MTIAFLTWAVAQMFYANIRVVAVAIAFGLAFMRVGPPEEDRESDHKAPAHRQRVPSLV